jgi:NADPH:quinone reductase-like Zn-dependent oxidoreductase
LRAFVYTQYGTPDVLELTEVPSPVPRDNEVLVKVHAVSLNDWDVGLLEGDFVNRMLNGRSKPKRTTILGSDIAGRVESIGQRVRRLRIGDEVYGDLSGRWGGFAEYVCAAEDALVIKPPGMSFEEAAAIPQAGMLAVQGLIDKGKIKNGQKILVNGAGGGVGTFAIQIAKNYEVQMTGVDNGSKQELMTSIGYHHVIDYTKEDFTLRSKQYDLILDAKTNRSMSDYLRALRPGGMYVTVGGSIHRLMQAFALSPFIPLVTGKKIEIVSLKPNKDLDYMNGLFQEGKLRPVIDGPYPFEELPNAFRLFTKGLHKGKIVINRIQQGERVAGLTGLKAM